MEGTLAGLTTPNSKRQPREVDVVKIKKLKNGYNVLPEGIFNVPIPEYTYQTKEEAIQKASELFEEKL